MRHGQVRRASGGIRGPYKNGRDPYKRPQDRCGAVEPVCGGCAANTAEVSDAGTYRRELVRLFRDVTGTGPQQFIADLRVRAARELLADPRRSITDVALETGFFDGPHLTRTFTRLVGLSPRAYRQRLQRAGIASGS